MIYVYKNTVPGIFGLVQCSLTSVNTKRLHIHSKLKQSQRTANYLILGLLIDWLVFYGTSTQHKIGQFVSICQGEHLLWLLRIANKEHYTKQLHALLA